MSSFRFWAQKNQTLHTRINSYVRKQSWIAFKKGVKLSGKAVLNHVETSVLGFIGKTPAQPVACDTKHSIMNVWKRISGRK